LLAAIEQADGYEVNPERYPESIQRITGLRKENFNYFGATDETGYSLEGEYAHPPYDNVSSYIPGLYLAIDLYGYSSTGRHNERYVLFELLPSGKVKHLHTMIYPEGKDWAIRLWEPIE